VKTVAMFGSARPTSDLPIYTATTEAAAMLVEGGWRVCTGGGPGLMEAANKGAKEACQSDSCSFGYSIFLPFEAETNEHVQEDTHHKTFFTRLEQFADADAFIALPGGIGTQLEILTVLQLMQVGHMDHKPLILVGPMWKKIFERTGSYLLSEAYICEKDLDLWRYANTPQEAARLLL